MLSARRKSDGAIVTAYEERRANGPFVCLVCEGELALRSGGSKVNHFAHVNPLACRFANGESDQHRLCKMKIYQELLREPYISDVELERPLGAVRPDISANINGVPVAIEVQISSLSIETIMHRTIEYHRKGIYVLWILQWTPHLDRPRYAPKLWEKWLHAAYFGRVYYWTSGLSIVSYTFEPQLQSVPRKTWLSKRGRKMTAGGFSRRSKRYRTPVRGRTLHLTRDFAPRDRFWWSGGGVTVPDAKLFAERYSGNRNN